MQSIEHIHNDYDGLFLGSGGGGDGTWPPRTQFALPNIPSSWASLTICEERSLPEPCPADDPI